MVTTRAGLRGTARAELNDNGAALLWSDALLNEWLAEAIRDYGRNLPREAVTTLTSVANQADYALPSDCQRPARVEHPSGFFRIPDPLSAGDLLDPLALSGAELPRAVATQLAYEVWGVFGAQTLTLRPAPAVAGESIRVRYLATYAEPSADGDTLATPAQDDHLLVFFMASRALRWLGTDEAKRQRWERDRGVSAQAAADQYGRDLAAEYARRQRRASPRRLAVRS